MTGENDEAWLLDRIADLQATDYVVWLKAHPDSTDDERIFRLEEIERQALDEFMSQHPELQHQFGVAPAGYKPRQKAGRHAHLSKRAKLLRMRAERALRKAKWSDVRARACARILSFGGGVQSTACLLKYWREYDVVLFADPGAEHVETYEHIERRVEPFCREKGLDFVTVRSDKGTLEEYCLERNVVPITSRRWCTQEYKIRPIQHYQREVLGATQENPVIVDLGISYDEYWRASKPQMTLWEFRNYPLVDAEITRQQCLDIVAAQGWPRPHKSACDFCPFKSSKDWRRLYAEHPERYKQIVELEQNGSDYPRTLLGRKPLHLLAENSRLTDHGFSEELEQEEQHCTSGFCFT